MDAQVNSAVIEIFFFSKLLLEQQIKQISFISDIVPN